MSILFAADSIRWPHGFPFLVASPENAHSLIGSDILPIGAGMRGGRILWGQIIIVLTIVFVMFWAATQWTAWRLGFQTQLGAPWFELAGWPVYYPPALIWWWFSFDAYAPSIFTEGGIIAASGGFLAIVVAITMSIIRARGARNVATYGSARWAEEKEIRNAGLLGPDGVVLGKRKRDYLRHDGPEHVLCFAPTRSAAPT